MGVGNTVDTVFDQGACGACLVKRSSAAGIPAKSIYSIVILLDTIDKHADVAELVDALDLGSSALVA